MKRLVLTIISFAAFVWMPVAAEAFSVSPGIIELSGVRGEVLETSFNIINTNAAEQMFYLGTMKFVPRDESGKPEFISPDVDLSGFPEWISFGASTVLVPANSVVEVPVTIAVPADVAAGGYYAAFVVSDAPYDVVATNGAVVNARTAILAFLTIEGETTSRTVLLDFTSNVANSVRSRFVGDFAFRLQNQGNVHVTPEATITLTDILGREVLHLDANAGDGRILPGSTRTFDGTFGDEQRTFLQIVGEQVSAFAMGPMKMTLHVEYPDGSSETVTHAFFLIPWQLLLCIVLGVGLLAGILKLFKKKRK